MPLMLYTQTLKQKAISLEEYSNPYYRGVRGVSLQFPYARK